MEKTMTKVMEQIEKLNVEKDIEWYIDDDDKLRVEVKLRFLDITSVEIKGHAGNSRDPALWVLRTLGSRMDLPVSVLDRICPVSE